MIDHSACSCDLIQCGVAFRRHRCDRFPYVLSCEVLRDSRLELD